MKRDNIKNLLGFTLIELLIVIGILAILAVALLLALNPAEIQKRTRHEKRLKDATTLQAILDQYINDGNSFGASCLAGGGCFSISGSGLVSNKSQPCNNNWLGINVCAYAQTIPVDPASHISNTRTFVDGARVVGSNYEIIVMQESEANRSRVVNDGGTSADSSINNQFMQLGSDLSLW